MGKEGHSYSRLPFRNAWGGSMDRWTLPLTKTTAFHGDVFRDAGAFTCVNVCDILNITEQLEQSLCIDHRRCCFQDCLQQPTFVCNNEQQPRLTPLICWPLAFAEIPRMCACACVSVCLCLCPGVYCMSVCVCPCEFWQREIIITILLHVPRVQAVCFRCALMSQSAR